MNKNYINSNNLILYGTDNMASTRRNKKTGTKRRKKKRFRGAIRMFIICLFLFLCIIISKGLSGIIFDLINGQGTDSMYTGQNGNNNAEEESGVIKKLRKENYPESLIELYKNHPETKEFVLDYPEYKNKKTTIDINSDVKKGKIPLFLQWDKRWGYRKYGGDFIAVTGCGPTCLSMVCCGLSGSTGWNPYKTAKMADENGFYVEGSGSSWDLMTRGAEITGLSYHEVRFEKDSILAELEAGNPVICSMGPGDFTTTGHFIVLTGTDGSGAVTVNDPNSIKNSSKTWELDDIMPQVRNLWGYSI